MRSFRRIKIKPFLLSILLAVFFYQDAIEKYIPSAKYLDEMFALFFLIYYMFIMPKKERYIDKKILLCVLGILIVGVIGNVRSEVNVSMTSIITDFFNVVKFTFVILGAPYFFSKYKKKKEITSYLTIWVRISVLLSTIFMLINLVFDIGMYTDIRYGLRAYNYIYSRVGGFYSACVIWLIILLAHMQYVKHKKRDLVFIGLVLINMCSTLRSRAIAFALMFLMIYYYYFVMKKRKFRWYYIIPFLALAFLIARDQIGFYYSGDRARNVLVRFGIITAESYFPFGAGFATYGTAVARDIYSPLYEQYGFAKYWGLSVDNTGFLTDNYWPAIIGEFGVIGLFIDIILLCLVIKKLRKHSLNKYSNSIVLFAFGTLFVSSLASSAFFACTQLMVFVCLFLNDNGIDGTRIIATQQ